MAANDVMQSGAQPASGPTWAWLPIEVRLVVAAIGAVPVTLIGASTFGVVELNVLAVSVLVPAVLYLGLIVAVFAPARRLVAQAVVMGVVATFFYDLFRWGTLAVGLMDRDPIPHIGTALGLEPGWLFGYLWRFIGNGGGIAIAFRALGGRGVAAGVVHGLVVCSGLIGVLAYSPHGQEALFPLTPVTLVIAVVGHIIYGAVLGHLSRTRRPPSRTIGCPPAVQVDERTRRFVR